jgi:putative RecB family exonuclease
MKGPSHSRDADFGPHLSYSQINRYLTCPEQYRLYYLEKLRPKFESASLVFGSVMHLALAEYFRKKEDLVATFEREWNAVQEFPLRYPQRDSWESLREKGTKLLQTFQAEEVQRFGEIFAVEQVHRIGLSNVDVPFVSIIDLVAILEGKRSLIEFKTAAADYEDYEIALHDQLTAYKLSQPDVEQIAVCVFVKTKEPRIRWHFTDRTEHAAVQFLQKAAIVAGEIGRGHFYKRPGKWCRQCDFVSVCTGNENGAKEMLVQIT